MQKPRAKLRNPKNTAGTHNRTTHSQPFLMSIFFACPICPRDCVCLRARTSRIPVSRASTAMPTEEHWGVDPNSKHQASQKSHRQRDGQWRDARAHIDPLAKPLGKTRRLGRKKGNGACTLPLGKIKRKTRFGCRKNFFL